MGKHFAIVAWLLTSLAIFPHVTYANDTGPGREVRAVRGTAQTLLVARVRAAGIDPKYISVSDVTIAGAHATAVWSAAALRGDSNFTYRYDRWWDDAGYDAKLGPALADIASIRVRAPSEAESWNYFPGGDAWAFFTIESNDAATHAMPAGTTISIWCPFVIDRDRNYSVTIAHADAPIGPLRATVYDNTFTIALPAFAFPAGARLMGEIDGFPVR